MGRGRRPVGRRRGDRAGGKPEELGDVVAFLLSARAGYLTGATIDVDGGNDV